MPRMRSISRSPFRSARRSAWPRCRLGPAWRSTSSSRFEVTTQQSENSREQEMSMRTIRTRTIACAVAMAAVLGLAPRRAQTTQTALSKEAGTLSDKFAGLARVMAGKYDWKPGAGVRSVGDAFNLIVTEHSVLVATLTGAGGVLGGAQVIAPEKLQEALKTSYANVQKAIEGLSDADLKAPVKLFGRDMTKEEAVRYLFGDQHEHLGQSIAYARSNGVVPPWSK